MDNNALKEQVMINQFVLAAGCSRDQATALLAQAGWQFQTALSIYFQEAAIPKNNSGFSLITPANTPATPPNFPDALTMFSNMSTSDKMATSPMASSPFSPRNPTGHPNMSQSARFDMMGPPPTRNSFSSPHPMCSPTSPSNFEHQQKHHQQQPSGGFIQPQNPWRGQTNSTQPLGAGINQASNFGTNCDQHQVQSQNHADASEGNFLTMEMEGIPQ